MSILSQIACTPCRPGEPPLNEEELAELHPMVPAWSLVRVDGVRKLENVFTFEEPGHRKNFLGRLEKIGERENHRPEMGVDREKVTVRWWTPEVGDLHPNDFILAAKTDGAFTLAVVGHEGDMMTDEPLPTLADVPRFRHTFQRTRGAAAG